MVPCRPPINTDCVSQWLRQWLTEAAAAAATIHHLTPRMTAFDRLDPADVPQVQLPVVEQHDMMLVVTNAPPRINKQTLA